MKPTMRYSSLVSTQMVGAKTVVMDWPPEMSVVLEAESRARGDSLVATRMVPSQTLSVMTTTEFRPPEEFVSPPRPPARMRPVASPPPPPPGALRTRMVDLRDALAGQALPPLPHARSLRSPPSPPPATWPLAASPLPPASQPALSPLSLSTRRRTTWVQALRERRSLLLIAALALLILVFMVPLLSSEGVAALAQAQAQTEPSSPTPARPRPSASPVTKPQSAPTLDAPSEAQVGALLLSGRRPEALAMYRRLAETGRSDEGIEAMIIVLEQKVVTP